MAGAEDGAYLLLGNRKPLESVKKHSEQGLVPKKCLINFSFLSIVVVTTI